MTINFANPLPDTEDSELQLLRKLVALNAAAGQPYQSGTNLYTFGDSHTEGLLAVATSWAPGQIVDLPHRWTTKLAAITGQTLTNRGISGSSWQYNAATSWQRQTVINRIGVTLPVTWSGTAVMMAGYNDAGASPATDFSAWSRHYIATVNAAVARALLDDYVTVDGLRSNGAAQTVTTTGTVIGEALPDGNPFPKGVPGTDPRRVLPLTGTQYVETTLTGRSTAAVFYSACATAGIWGPGGTFVVTVNGVQQAEIDCIHPGGSVNESMGVVILRNLPASAVIRVTNVSGTSRIWAVGWLSAANTATALGRSIVLCSPARFESAARNSVALRAWAVAIATAAAQWSDYRVFFADVGGNTDATHTVTAAGDGADPDHASRGGNTVFARVIATARRVVTNEKTATIQLPHLDQAGEVRAFGVAGSAVAAAHARIFYVLNRAHLESIDSSGSRGVLVLRGTTTYCDTGPLAVGYTNTVAVGDALNVMAGNGSGLSVSFVNYALPADNWIGARIGTYGPSDAPGMLLRRWTGTAANHGQSWVGIAPTGTSYDFVIHHGTAATANSSPTAVPERLRITSEGAIRFAGLAAAPATPANGDVYYDTTLGKLRVYAAGAWVNLH
jgi:hypothetical protein